VRSAVLGNLATALWRDIPRVSRIGLLVIASGLVLDTIVHVFLTPAGSDVVVAGFSVPEHAAHFVVLVGMILVIGGVMADGARLSLPRKNEGEGEEHAIR
jgi:hypothetical protein